MSETSESQGNPTIWDRIAELYESYEGERFMGTPDAWYEPASWWCQNGHRSRFYIKSEAKGCFICPACRQPVILGPLEIPGVEAK